LLNTATRRQQSSKRYRDEIKSISRSIHVTRRNFKGLTKTEIDAQSNDTHSDLMQWTKKKEIKKSQKKRRKKG